MIHDRNCAACIQIDRGFTVFEDDLTGICGYHTHSTVSVTGFDLQHVIIDQEDVLNLHEIRFGPSEDRIHITREDRNLTLPSYVCRVCIYPILFVACIGIDDLVVKFLPILAQRQPHTVTIMIDLLGSECKSSAKSPSLAGCHGLLIAAAGKLNQEFAEFICFVVDCYVAFSHPTLVPVESIAVWVAAVNGASTILI